MRILFIVALLFISALAGIYLSQDAGYVIISFQNTTIETTLLVALLILLASLVVLSVIYKSLKYIIAIPGKIRLYFSRRKQRKAQEMTRKGLIEYSEGYWQKAQQNLIKALPQSDAPLINYLTAARAAQQMGNSKQRDQYLRDAQKSMPEAKIAVELTQAELQLANQQWEQALATLKHLKILAPKHPYVLKLLMYLYEEVRDWRQLIAILPQLKKQQILTTAEHFKLNLLAYTNALKEMIKFEQREALLKFVEQLPSELYYNPELNHLYCNFLITQNLDDMAEKKLKACLKKGFNELLIDLYGKCDSDKNVQLKFAEGLLKKHPHSAALFLCLGRLSFKNQLWGKAQQYLRKSIEFHPSAENHVELGKLYEQLDEPLKASLTYKKGLGLTLNQ